MAVGARFYNPAGEVVGDLTDYFGRVLGVVDITAGVNGSVTDAGLALGVPGWQLHALQNFPVEVPTVTVSGTTLSWAFQSGQPAYDCLLRYWVF
ncbi:hypothetical protein FKB34_01760 [Glycocaulis profundi]|nr:hypothetical protein FKB34_01760 [Glycocaulis profundi]